MERFQTTFHPEDLNPCSPNGLCAFDNSASGGGSSVPDLDFHTGDNEYPFCSPEGVIAPLSYAEGSESNGQLVRFRDMDGSTHIVSAVVSTRASQHRHR